MSQLHGDGKECRLIRGYKLTSLPLPDSGIESIAYSAQAVIVIQHADGRYESLACNNVSSDPSPFVFVPSSRMHPELSDEQLLSCHFALAEIIDGPAAIVDTLIRMRCTMSRFEQRKLCRSPEEAPTVKNLMIRYFPHFEAWSRKRCKLCMHVDIAIAFGMATRPMTDTENEYILSGGMTEAPRPLVEDRRSLTKETGEWTFERDVWLQGVAALHMFVDGTATQQGCDENEAVARVYFQCYDSLQIEYAKRFCRAAEKESMSCGAERAEALYSEFR